MSPFADVARGEHAGGFPRSADGFPTLVLSYVFVSPYLRTTRRSYALKQYRWFQKLAATLGGRCGFLQNGPIANPIGADQAHLREEDGRVRSHEVGERLRVGGGQR
eukprot:4271691-Pyramimonas_sp.AAC.1